MKFDRVYHPYWDWEEVDHNMWGSVSNRAAYLDRAIKFTSDHKKYGRFMMKVINNWPISCENALTDSSLNRKAWVGHAACALAMGCPEDIVRKAWGYLTDEQQQMANRQAVSAIRHWEIGYAKSKGIRVDVDKTLL